MTGFSNVVHGIEHFLTHLINGDGVIGDTIKTVANEVVDYEKQHGREQLQIAVQAAETAFKAAYKPGVDAVLKATKLAVDAFFESDAAQVKTLSTQAALFLVSGVAK